MSASSVRNLQGAPSGALLKGLRPGGTFFSPAVCRGAAAVGIHTLIARSFECPLYRTQQKGVAGFRNGGEKALRVASLEPAQVCQAPAPFQTPDIFSRKVPQRQKATLSGFGKRSSVVNGTLFSGLSSGPLHASQDVSRMKKAGRTIAHCTCLAPGVAVREMDMTPSPPQLEKPRPNHLLVLVSGINSTYKDWKFSKEQLQKKLGDAVVIHASEGASAMSIMIFPDSKRVFVSPGCGLRWMKCVLQFSSNNFLKKLVRTESKVLQ